MSNEIESVKPTISVIIDDGDFIINSTGPIGKAMAQAILPLAAGAHRVTVISDGEMKVLKRNPATEVQSPQTAAQLNARRSASRPASPSIPDGPDIQDQFAADLEAGITGEIATGEAPKPPAPIRRKPVIFQDAAAPPAPELVEAEMDRLLQEAAQAEVDATKVAEDRRFQAQQAVQAGDDTAPAESEAPASPRKRERNLAINGSPCGNCGGGGQSVRVDGTGSFIPDENGHPMRGVCQVCSGTGQIKSWGRGRGRGR